MKIFKGNIDNSPLKSMFPVGFEEFVQIRESLLLEDEREEREIKARIKIQRAVLWLNINRGFFGELLSNLNIYGSSDLEPKTMATNGLNIVYHPDFVLGQTDAAIRFVLCHEILHCVGEHMARRGSRDPQIWNYAADYSINPILNLEANEGFAWPKNPDGSRMGLYEAQYEGMRAEDIYDILVKDQSALSKLAKMMSDMGAVIDGDQDLPAPDSENSIAREVYRDEEEEGEEGPGGIPKGKGEEEGEEKGASGTKGEGEEEGEGEGTGDKGTGEEGEGTPPEIDLVGKQVRITEGPEKGKIVTVKKVYPNGDVEVE